MTISDTQLTNCSEETLNNPKWQQLVEDFRAAWEVDKFKQAEDIFGEIVDISSVSLLKTAKFKLHTAIVDMADDIVAEAYLAFYEILIARKPIQNARALLHQIVRFRCADECRRYDRKEKVVASPDEISWESLQEVPDVLGNTPEEIVVLHDTSNIILDALPSREKQVLSMRYIQELSVDEIAKKLHITVDQVKKMTQRAIKQARCVAQERGLLNDFS